MKKATVLIAIFGLLSGCFQPTKKDPSKITIVCSTSIIASCLDDILGEEYQIVSLMGPGVDPHSYNARPSDALWLEKADIIVYNGFHLEGKMATLFHQLSSRKKTYAIADFFPKHLQRKIDNQGAIDPHIWFCTTGWKMAVNNIIEQEILLRPTKNRNTTERLNKWNNRIEAIEKHFTILLTTIPKKQRVLITSHDAFFYLGKQFDIEVKAIQGVSTVQEGNIGTFAALGKFIQNRRIPAVFVENSVNPNALKALVENANSKQHQVKIGGSLYSDALGNTPQSNSYINMLNYNLSTVYNGLKP